MFGKRIDLVNGPSIIGNNITGSCLKSMDLGIEVGIKEQCGKRTSQSIQTRGSVEREGAMTRLGISVSRRNLLSERILSGKRIVCSSLSWKKDGRGYPRRSWKVVRRKLDARA